MHTIFLTFKWIKDAHVNDNLGSVKKGLSTQIRMHSRVEWILAHIIGASAGNEGSTIVGGWCGQGRCT